MATQLGDKFGRATALGALRQVARLQDDPVRTAAVVRETLPLNRDIGNRGAIVNDLDSLTWVARTRGDLVRSARLLGMSESLREQVKIRSFQLDPDEREREVETVRAQLGESAFAEARAEGQAMRLDQAIAYALEGTGPA